MNKKKQLKLMNVFLFSAVGLVLAAFFVLDPLEITHTCTGGLTGSYYNTTLQKCMPNPIDLSIDYDPRNICNPVPSNYNICGGAIALFDGEQYVETEYAYLHLANGDYVKTDCLSDEYPKKQNSSHFSCSYGVWKTLDDTDYIKHKITGYKVMKDESNWKDTIKNYSGSPPIVLEGGN